MNALVCDSMAARVRLDALRAELADLAFDLETQGRHDAADVANLLGLRLAGFAAEFVVSPGPAEDPARHKLS